MKKILLAASLITTATTIAIAAPHNEKVVIQEAQEMPIKIEELPDSVKQTIATSYADWKPVAAFKINETGGTYYKVDFTKGEEKSTIKFNEAGKVIEKPASANYNEGMTVIAQEETPVKVEELPDGVKNTIKESYADWTPVAAYKKVNEKGEFYKVEFTKGEEKATVKFDAEGKVIDKG